jgi:DNA-directed RNA polymerase subunit RPC12/RpoP
MKRSRVPFVTAVYEERVANPPAPGSEPAQSQAYECDLCGKTAEGSPAGSGLLLWWRGDEMRVEEPPLCEDCASRITMGAVAKWAIDGEEES